MPDKLLMIADADGLWTKRYIENLLLPQGYEVTLFPIWGDKGKFDDFYRENGIHVYRDTHRLPVISHIPRLRMWARVWLNARALCRLGAFDIVHNHYLSQRDLALGDRVRRRFGARWVCSFWGSDLMRAPQKELRRMRPYLDKCDAITVHNEDNVRRIGELYGDAIRGKTTLLYFGQTGYNDIDRVRAIADKAACKRHFGIDPDTTVVCVGYSASTSQQHMAALDAVARMERLSDITLVLQMTYGLGDKSYMDKVRERASALGCRYVILTDFMDGTESAYLRLAADVYAHTITTDAFSASLQEYLYAGAIVLSGAWLPYPQLRDMGIELARFADFDALAPLLDSAVAGGLAPLTSEQRALFPKLYSWSAVRGDWLKTYGL